MVHAGCCSARVISTTHNGHLADTERGDSDGQYGQYGQYGLALLMSLSPEC